MSGDVPPAGPRRRAQGNMLLSGMWWQHKNGGVYQVRSVLRDQRRVHLVADTGEEETISFSALHRDYRQVDAHG